MFEGLDLKKPGAQFHYFNWVMRRVCLVFLALWWRDYPSLQIGCYMILSLANALYLIWADPLIVETFEDVINNFMEILNECCVLIQSYFALCILFSLDADQNYVMNEGLTAVIRGQLAINFFWIFRSIAGAIKDGWKQRLTKKYGMNFGDVQKKRNVKYFKKHYATLSQEDVDLAREKYDAKVARR